MITLPFDREVVVRKVKVWPRNVRKKFLSFEKVWNITSTSVGDYGWNLWPNDIHALVAY